MEYLAKVRPQQCRVGDRFPLVFPIAMQHWLPVTQGGDQYRVSGTAEQAATANTPRRLCNVVIRARVNTVVEAVQPSIQMRRKKKKDENEQTQNNLSAQQMLN